MIVQCTGCRTKYKIPDERVPASGVEVRCPKCKAVFEVRREEERGESLAEQLFGRGVGESPLGSGNGEMETAAEAPAEDTETVVRETPGPEGLKEKRGKNEDGEELAAAADTPAGEGASIGRVEPPEEGAPEEPVEEEKEAASFPTKEAASAEATSAFEPPEQDPRTLARALVSDILFYNRKKRDQALEEDKILAYLGKEIARSWEIYKERVGIATAVETDHFKEAVNQILAEGKKIL